MAEKIRAGIEALNVAHRAATCSDRVTISVGGACVVPRRGDAYAGLIEVADAALYQAKHEGRNRAIVQEPRVPPVVHVQREG